MYFGEKYGLQVRFTSEFGVNLTYNFYVNLKFALNFATNFTA